MIALYYWPYNPITRQTTLNATQLNISLICAFVSIIVRPPIALIWLSMGIHLLTTVSYQQMYKIIFKHVLPVFIIVFSINTLLDYLFYHSITFPLFNFIQYNFGPNNVSSLYGIHGWYWYLVEGLPVMLGLYTPLYLLNLMYTIQYRHSLYYTYLTLLALTLYSISAHKEYGYRVINKVSHSHFSDEKYVYVLEKTIEE